MKYWQVEQLTQIVNRHVQDQRDRAEANEYLARERQILERRSAQKDLNFNRAQYEGLKYV